jgi:hypothetical protein
MVWFHGDKQEIEDATPERTPTRTLTETIGFKVREINLRLLGTESSGQNKRYVYIARVRPGSIPNATSASLAVWATWKELISARRTGYLVRGDQQFPDRYENFRKPINGWMNKNDRLEQVFQCWKAPYADIDAVFWWILALRKISARLSGYGSITFR